MCFSHMAQSNISYYYRLLQIAALLGGVFGQCPLQEDALPTVPHGRKSNVDNVKLSSEGTAVGYYEIECDPGFALDSTIGGRISCLESGQWSNPLPQCVSTSKASTRCPYTDEMLKFANGHISFAEGFLKYDDHTAEGSLVVSCSLKYAMDSVSRGVFSCNEGVWSPRPSCTKMNWCSLEAVNNFLKDPALTHDLDIVTQRITLVDGEKDAALVGSYIRFACSDGNTNTDGNLNVKCQNNGQWTPFPSCAVDPTTAAAEQQ